MSCHSTLLDCFVTFYVTFKLCCKSLQILQIVKSLGTIEGTQVTQKVQTSTSWVSGLNQSFTVRLLEVVDLPKFEIVGVSSITNGDDKNDKDKSN